MGSLSGIKGLPPNRKLLAFKRPIQVDTEPNPCLQNSIPPSGVSWASTSTRLALCVTIRHVHTAVYMTVSDSCSQSMNRQRGEKRRIETGVGIDLIRR